MRRTDRLKDGMQYLMQAPRKGNIITNNFAMASCAGLLQQEVTVCLTYYAQNVPNFIFVAKFRSKE